MPSFFGGRTIMKRTAGGDAEVLAEIPLMARTVHPAITSGD
jgi:hypothetical protein